MKTYRIYIFNGYEYEWTSNTVEAKSVHAARKIWNQKGSPSQTWRFRVMKEDLKSEEKRNEQHL